MGLTALQPRPLTLPSPPVGQREMGLTALQPRPLTLPSPPVGQREMGLTALQPRPLTLPSPPVGQREMGLTALLETTPSAVGGHGAERFFVGGEGLGHVFGGVDGGEPAMVGGAVHAVVEGRAARRRPPARAWRWRRQRRRGWS